MVNGRSMRPGWNGGGGGGWVAEKCQLELEWEERLTNKHRTSGYMYAFMVKVVPKGLQSVDIGFNLN